MSKPRYFQVAAGRVVIPPRGLIAGPGATNMRFQGGETLELPAAKVDRFIRNRVAAGDLVELREPPAASSSPPPATTSFKARGSAGPAPSPSDPKEG